MQNTRRRLESLRDIVPGEGVIEISHFVNVHLSINVENMELDF